MANKKLTPEEKLIEDALSKINKDYGDGTIMDFSKKRTIALERVDTGLPSLDLILGGGVPKGRIMEIYGLESSGKCHAEGTKVLTYDGSVKKVEDIIVGDKLMGVDSKPRTVLQLARGKEKMYKIIPSKGKEDSFIVNENHVLSLQRTNGDGRNRGGEIVNISIKDYLATNSYFKTYHHLYRVGVEFNNYKTVPFDAYFLGLWLGDGDSYDARITTIDKKIIQFLDKYAKDNNWYMHTTKCKNRCWKYAIRMGRGYNQYKSQKDSLYLRLKKIGLFGNKHIPKNFLLNTRENRLKLLAGLIDSDGYKRETGIGFCNTNKKLCEQVKFLALSLGFFASILQKKTSLKTRNYTGIAYEVLINGEFSELPLKLKRKVPNKKTTSRNSVLTGFSIKELPEDNFYGFTLDGNHLYLLDSFIVNHNTTMALHILSKCQKEGKRVAYIDMEHALNPPYAELLGVDMNKLIFSQPSNGNQALEIANNLTKTGVVSVIVIDSVANLVPSGDTEKTLDSNATIGGRARLLSQALPQLAISANKSGTIIIFINQVRENIGVMYGPSTTTPGGKALKFNASIRLMLSAKKAEERDGKVGCPVIVRVKKNKTAIPFRETELFLIYGEGLDTFTDFVNTAVACGIINKSGGWYSYDKLKEQGLSNFIVKLKNEAKYFKDIKEKILQKAKEVN